MKKISRLCGKSWEAPASALPLSHTGSCTRLLIGFCIALVSSFGCKQKPEVSFYVPPRVADDASTHPQTDAGSDAHAGTPAVPKPVGCDHATEQRMLFIGNSHTYENDVPALVRQLACEAGVKLVTEQVAPGGIGFVEHAASAKTLAALAQGGWDFVILQDQQQRPGFRLDEIEREHVPSARALADAARTASESATLVLFMVWARIQGDLQNCGYYPPACSFETSTRAIVQGYELYAERTGSQVAPVALAWAAVRADPAAPLNALELNARCTLERPRACKHSGTVRRFGG